MHNKQLMKGVVVFHTYKQEDKGSCYKTAYSYEQMNKIQAGADIFRHLSAQVWDGY